MHIYKACFLCFTFKESTLQKLVFVRCTSAPAQLQRPSNTLNLFLCAQLLFLLLLAEMNP